MKNKVWGLLVLVMILGLGGCSEQSEPEGSVSSLPEQQAAVQIAPATQERLEPYGIYYEYIRDEDGEQVLIWADKPLKEFAFITVDNVSEGEELRYFVGEVLFSLPELPVERPLMVSFLMPGLLPSYGITFLDEDDAMHCYTIQLGGRGEEEAPPYFLLPFDPGDREES